MTLAVALLLSACGAARVSLANLARHQSTYAGEQVTTSGTVRHFTDSGGYDVLEDADGNRVLVAPESAVDPYLGRTVTVTGRFSVDPAVGRTISVQSVRP